MNERGAVPIEEGEQTSGGLSEKIREKYMCNDRSLVSQAEATLNDEQRSKFEYHFGSTDLAIGVMLAFCIRPQIPKEVDVLLKYFESKKIGPLKDSDFRYDEEGSQVVKILRKVGEVSREVQMDESGRPSSVSGHLADVSDGNRRITGHGSSEANERRYSGS